MNVSYLNYKNLCTYARLRTVALLHSVVYSVSINLLTCTFINNNKINGDLKSGNFREMKAINLTVHEMKNRYLMFPEII